jgi:hypothetical protein
MLQTILTAAGPHIEEKIWTTAIFKHHGLRGVFIESYS